jgi:hypothetical protein
MLPDEFLMQMFFILQAEYTYGNDDTDLLNAAKTGGLG